MFYIDFFTRIAKKKMFMLMRSAWIPMQTNKLLHLYTNITIDLDFVKTGM